MYIVKYISNHCNMYIRRPPPYVNNTHIFPKYLCTLHGIRAYPKFFFIKKKKKFRSLQVNDGNRYRVGYQVALSVRIIIV